MKIQSVFKNIFRKLAVICLGILLLFIFNTVASRTYTLFDGHLECHEFSYTEICTADIIYYYVKKVHIVLSADLLEQIPGTKEYKFKCINDYLRSIGKQPGVGVCGEACGQYFCAD